MLLDIWKYNSGKVCQKICEENKIRLPYKSCILFVNSVGRQIVINQSLAFFAIGVHSLGIIVGRRGGVTLSDGFLHFLASKITQL